MRSLKQSDQPTSAQNIKTVVYVPTCELRELTHVNRIIIEMLTEACIALPPTLHHTHSTAMHGC